MRCICALWCRLHRPCIGWPRNQHSPLRAAIRAAPCGPCSHPIRGDGRSSARAAVRRRSRAPRRARGDSGTPWPGVSAWRVPRARGHGTPGPGLCAGFRPRQPPCCRGLFFRGCGRPEWRRCGLPSPGACTRCGHPTPPAGGAPSPADWAMPHSVVTQQTGFRAKVGARRSPCTLVETCWAPPLRLRRGSEAATAPPHGRSACGPSGCTPAAMAVQTRRVPSIATSRGWSSTTSPGSPHRGCLRCGTT